MRNDAGADDYLWDPTAPPDQTVIAVERRLAPLRGRLPDFRVPPSARWATFLQRRTVVRVAAAAAIVLLAGAGLGVYRWTWPDGRAWTTRSTAGVPDRLEVGRPLTLGPADRAEIAIARIGSMQVHPGSTLTLRSTASNRHRLVLTEGAVQVRVWAPPGAVVIKTPAGDLVDLGCAFELTVDAVGTAHVSVQSGWVQLDNVHGETLVPAGASSTMVLGRRASAPVFDDAAPEFREGIRQLEADLQTPARPVTPLTFLSASRAKDVLTLLVVAAHATPDVAALLLQRAAILQPPPPGVSLESITAGDRGPLWRWYDALELPPPKRWVWNWRDGF